MAAPQKAGLDYYPRSTDLLKDRKFVKAKIKYGYLSIVVYDAILEMVYRDKGYYLEYTDETKEDVVWDILETLRGKYAVEAETVCDVIGMLVECRLFSHDHFKQGIITGKRIQETYYKATVERKNVEVDPNIWMLSVLEMQGLSAKSSILSFFINRAINGVNRPINEDNQPINPQIKQKEKKQNKSKVNYTILLDLYHKYWTDIDTKTESVLCVWSDKNININWIQEAFDIAVSKGKHFNYAEGIVNKWIAEGKPQISKPVQTTKFVNYKQPEYTDDEIEAAIQRKKQRRTEGENGTE